MSKSVYTTEKGTELFWEVNYNLGGHNYVSGRNEPRGYSLFIKRQPNRFMVHHNLSEPDGANRMFLLEVSRKSDKRYDEAFDMALAELPKIAERFDI